MAQVNVHDAKTQLSRLLARVERGEEIVIARKGTPVARLVPVVARRVRRPGAWKGKVRYGDDLPDPLPAEVAERFYGDGS
jgi:prevent-host-death family protein